MLDYLDGDRHAYVEVSSPNLDMWKMRGEVMFRSFATMGAIERVALGECKGKILDVGAGSGCHSLYLQKQHMDVDALDISPGAIEVMKKRKIAKPIHGNLFALEGKRYDTVLMLMNGMGICGTLDGLNLFFQFSKTILAANGQIIADSTDLASLYHPDSLSLQDDVYYGETAFVMRYNNIVGAPFPWLYIDFSTLEYYAGFQGLCCEKLIANKTGSYLVRITTEG